MNSIFHRVSVRRYQDKPVEKEKIDLILRAAMQAPSASNQQPWEFYVVTDPDMLVALSKSHPYAQAAANATVAIVPAYRTDCALPAYAHVDLAAATENMLLEIDALGLGGVWLGVTPLEERMTAVEALLDMPANLRAFAIVPFGYPLREKEQQDRFDESRIHYV